MKLQVDMQEASLRRGGADRRAAVRFPIVRDVRYKVFNSRQRAEVGVGQTVNISSGGILFTTENQLVPGQRVELSVSWPAQLDNKCMLKLVTTGRVVRAEEGKAAIAIERYEFRTQGSLTLASLRPNA